MPTKTKTGIESMINEAKSLMVIEEYEQVSALLEDMDEALTELIVEHEDAIEELQEEKRGLQESLDELNAVESTHVINTAFGKIHYRMEAGHLVDEQVMEALEEAFRTLTPVRIVNRLSDCICH